MPKKVDGPWQVPRLRVESGALLKGEADPGRRPEAQTFWGAGADTLQQAGPYAVEALAQNTTAELDRGGIKKELASQERKCVIPNTTKNGLSG